VDPILEALRTVGFSQYEAKLYVALLRYGAQNGNELSRSSAVPSSKVYSTVEKLIAEGSVQSIKSQGGTQYVAVAPDELLGRLRRRYNDPLDVLAERLPALTHFVPDDLFLNLEGREAVLAGAREIVARATSQLYVSVWSPEILVVADSFAEAAERGVEIFGMLYADDGELPPGHWLRHSYEEIVAARIGGRMLSLVADGSEALIARFTDGTAAGVRTRNPVLTLIVSEYLHHDIVLQRAQMSIGFDEWDRWWTADPALRAEILGEVMERGAPTAASESQPGRPKRRRTSVRP
jgi:sugar-specific transcriptional regulator TrmB